MIVTRGYQVPRLHARVIASIPCSARYCTVGLTRWRTEAKQFTREREVGNNRSEFETQKEYVLGCSSQPFKYTKIRSVYRLCPEISLTATNQNCFLKTTDFQVVPVCHPITICPGRQFATPTAPFFLALPCYCLF